MDAENVNPKHNIYKVKVWHFSFVRQTPVDYTINFGFQSKNKAFHDALLN